MKLHELPKKTIVEFMSDDFVFLGIDGAYARWFNDTDKQVYIFGSPIQEIEMKDGKYFFKE